LAGNRQQSRLLAFLSNYKRYVELSDIAANSANASQLQYLKTLDSIDAKTQQIKTSIQGLYTESGIEEFYKGLLDVGNNMIKTFTQMPTLLRLPIPAITKLGTQFLTVSKIVTSILTNFRNTYNFQQSQLAALTQTYAKKRQDIEEQLNNANQQSGQQYNQQYQQLLQERARIDAEYARKRQDILNQKIPGQKTGLQTAGMVLGGVGVAATTVAGALDVNENRTAKAVTTGLGSLASGVGMGMLMSGGNVGIAVLMGALTALPGILEAVGIATEKVSEKVERLNSKLEESSNNLLKSKDELRTLEDYKKKYDELYKARNDSNEAYQEYLKLSNEIAANYPSLISSMDEEGNYVVELKGYYQDLVEAKREAYNKDFIENGLAQIEAYSDPELLLKLFNIDTPGEFKLFSDSAVVNKIAESFKTIPADVLGNISYTEAMRRTNEAFDYGGFIDKNNVKNLFGVDQSVIGKNIEQFLGADVIKELSKESTYSPTDQSYMDPVVLEAMLEKIGVILDENKGDFAQVNKELNQAFGEDARFNDDLIGFFQQMSGSAQVRSEYLNKIIKSLNITATKEAIDKLGLDADALTTDFLAENVQQDWEGKSEGQKDIKAVWQSFQLDLESIVQSYFDSFELYKDLSKEEKEKANNFYKNVEQYGSERLRDALSEAFEGNQDLQQYIYDHLIESTQWTFDRFKKSFEESDSRSPEFDLSSRSNWFRENFGAEYLDSISKLYTDIVEDKSFSTSQKSIRISALDTLYSEVAQADADIAQKIKAAVGNGELDSLTGIYALRDELANLGLEADNPIFKALDNISNLLAVNLPREYEVFADDLGKKTEEFDKALSTATKGMDFKTASEVAARMNIAISEFRFTDGKYYVDNIEAIQQSYAKYNKALLDDLNNKRLILNSYINVGAFDNDTSRMVNAVNTLAAQWEKTDEEGRTALFNRLNIQTEEEINQYRDILSTYLPGYKASGESKNITFSAYIAKEIQAAYEEGQEAINYNNTQLNNYLIQLGYFEEALKNILPEEEKTDEKIAEYIKKIKQNDFSDLPDELESYTTVLVNSVKDISKNVFDTAIRSITSGRQGIAVTNQNRQLLHDLGATDSTGELVSETTKQAYLEIGKNEIDNLRKSILANVKPGADQRSLLQSLHNAEFGDNLYSALESVISSYDKLSYDTVQKLAVSLGYNSVETFSQVYSIAQDELGNYSIDFSEIQRIIRNEDVKISESLVKSYGQYIDKSFSELNNAFTNQAKGYTSIESMQAFAAQIDYTKNFEELFAWDDSLHAYILTTTGLVEQIKTLRKKLIGVTDKQERNVINQLLSDTNRQLAESLKISDYVSALAKGDGNGKTEAKLRKALNTYYDTISEFGDGVVNNTEEIIAALKEGGTKAVLAYESIAKVSGIEIDSSTIDAFYRLKVANLQSAQEAITGGVGSIIDQSTYNLLMAASALHKDKEVNFNADQIGKTGKYVITSVGDMVDVYQAIYNEMVESNVSTTAELNAAYAKVLEAGESEDSAMVSALSDAAGMTYTRLGEILAEQGYQLTQELVNSLSDANIIQKIGTKKIRITDFDAFAKAMGWVDHNSEEYTSALRSYNDSLIEINNHAKSNIIEETNNLMSAKGGDWVNLSQIFSDLDEKWEEFYRERYLPKDFNGRAFLAQDFGKGAKNLGLAFSSITEAGEILSDEQLTEYVRDIVAQSDGTIESMKAIDSAVNGGKNLMLDATQLAEDLERNEALAQESMRAFGKQTGQENLDFLTLIGNERVSPLKKLNAILSQYGASLENGILKIQEGANVPAIIRTVTDSVEAYADLSAEETAKLLDSLNESLKQYVNLLTNGIGGKLNNQQASQLSTWAKTLGIDLTFTETIDGLKISRYEAEQLYEVLKGIDEVQAQIAFKSLKEAFEEAGAECENISVTMASIAKIQEQIAKAEGDTSGLQKRLSLYQEIARVQSADPDQYKFMDRKLPDGMQGPVNSWNAVGKMLTTLDEVASASGDEKGLLDVTAFYNIANEMNNLAATMGHSMTVFGMTVDGSAESAAALIEKGFSTLKNVDGKGVKVALNEWGIDFSAGAEGMIKGVDEGIKAFAKSQIQMLDAAIQMLEALVAFEKLGDIDINNDGVFNMKDMFNFDENNEPIAEYTAGFQAKRDEILKASEANKDLQKALDNFRIRNVTLRQLLTLSAQELKNLGFTLDDQYKIYKYISDKIKNGDFKGDLTDIQQLQLLFKDFNEPITVDTGSQIIQISGPSSYIINYEQISDDVLKKAIEQAGEKFDSREKAIERVKQVAAESAQGKPITVASQIMLGITSLQIQYDENTKTYIVGGKEFKDQAQAAVARTLMNAGIDLKNTTFTDDMWSGSGESLSVKVKKKLSDNVEIEITAGADQKVTYSSEGLGSYDSEDKLIAELARRKFYPEDKEKEREITAEDIHKYKIEQGIELAGDVSFTNEAQFKNATHEQIQKLVQAVINAPKTGNYGAITAEAKNLGIQVDIGQKGEGFDLAVQGLEKLTGLSFKDDSLNTQLVAVSEAVKSLGDVSLTQFSTDFAAITNSLVTLQTLDATKITAIFEAISKLGGGNTAEGGAAATVNWSAISEQLSGISTAIDDATSSLEAFNAKIAEISGNVDSLQKKIEALSALQINLKDNVNDIQTKIKNITVPPKSVTLYANTNPLQEAVNKLDLKTTVTVTYAKVPVPTPTPTPTPMPTPNNQYTYAHRDTRAKGNTALAKGTLMGELGPELYVSGGHYYVAGQNGAEFVNLPDDAIVFNHLQTKKLLEGRNINGRGDPVTSERAATSFATGNARGDAMASASQALAALKQIRAMWQSMLDASMKDLGAKANSGGKGGGGGSNKGNKTNAAFIADLERWYNLLRQIAKLESKINYEEQLRSKISSDMIQNGTAYYDSQKRTLDYLDQQIARQRELSNLQKSYYDARRQDLATSNYGKIFTFNDEGLMQYNDEARMANGDRGGLFALAEIIRQNPDGSSVYTAQQQYEILKSWGFEQDMKYDDKGKEIVYDENSKNADDYYTKSVQAFWDKVDAWKEELDGLYDDYNTKLTEILENEDQRNKILQEMIDNQISLEQKVVKAIEDREQKIIDEFEDTMEALQDSADKMIDGLNDQLDKERQMYENNNNASETERLRRQLAILQRSGGSASQIRDLQNQIADRDREAYFEAQQQQIDAIQQASELEIERLDAQLNVMTEALEYQKENGLLWQEVYQVMSLSRDEIANFIMTNGSEWAPKSSVQIDNDLNSLRSSIEQWIARREDNDPVAADAQHNWNNYLASSAHRYGKVLDQGTIELAKAAYDSAYKTTSDPNRAAEAADKILQTKLDEYFAKNPSAMPQRPEPKNIPTTTTTPTTKSNDDDSSSKKSSGSGGSGGSSTSSTKKSSSSGGGWHYQLYNNHKAEGSPSGAFKTREEAQKYGAKAARDHGYGWTYVTKWFKEGGLDDYTGLAVMHGTKTRPEAVFNAEQTKILRDDILSPKRTSLMSMLNSLRGYLDTGTTTSMVSNENNSAVTIDHLEFNMNASIANDYDARRAGENAMEEMVKIARKTSIQSLSRR